MKHFKTKQTFFNSFLSAFNGIKYAILSERNLKIHIIFSITSYILGFIFNLSIIEWNLLIISTLLLIICEIINSAIECVVDLTTKQNRLRAKLSKDMAAGAVLVCSILAASVVILLFYSRLANLLS